MKWNAIITKKQYENALLRESELEKKTENHDDERALLRLLIKDYEDRNFACLNQAQSSQSLKLKA